MTSAILRLRRQRGAPRGSRSRSAHSKPIERALRRSCTVCATGARAPLSADRRHPFQHPPGPRSKQPTNLRGWRAAKARTPFELRDRHPVEWVKSETSRAHEVYRSPRQGDRVRHSAVRVQPIHHGSRTARNPIMRCACSDGHAAERAVVLKSIISTKKLPPRSTRYAPVSGPCGLSPGEEA
jgi:hypothetical protein